MIDPGVFGAKQLDFPVGSGEIAELLATKDWRTSPLGPPASWTHALKTLMATVLPVESQIALFWGPQYVALYNAAYAPTIGEKHPRAFGQPFIENWPETWDDVEPLLRNVRETGQTFSAKDRPFYIERHGCGETVYFDVSYSPVREADGSVGGVLCVVTETTERVLFERRQAFLLELGQTLPVLTEPQRVEAEVLQRLGEELGAARVFFAECDEAGDSFHVRKEYRAGAVQIFEQPQRQDFPLELLAALGSGQSQLNAANLEPPPRLHGPVSLHVPLVRQARLEAVLVIEQMRPLGLSHAARRLAEETAEMAWGWLNHARAEAALRASSAQLSAMFDQASAGIAVCDRNWSFNRVNDRYCEIVGRSREELLGLRMHDVTHPEDLSRQAARCESNLNLGSPFDVTKRYSRTDGSSVWVQNHITPLLDQQRTITGLLCVSVDISARMDAEAELRALNESLEERVATIVGEREAALAKLHDAHKMEMVGQLTGGIAHDFNNLLTPIIGSLELIRRRLADGRSTRLVDGALQAADRARTLVGRLLTFARRQTLKPDAVSLAELVEGMRELIQRSLGPRIEIVIEIPDRLPAVFIDSHQLELAILNLAVNARDAMEDGGRLRLEARLVECDDAQGSLGAGTYVQLSVRDNGTGMDEETLQRCVEPFFSTKGVGKGTGLGLSMVQGLLMQSGGGFEIASQAGQGTRVTLWLAVSEEPTQVDHSPLAEAPMATRPALVLLVDDEDLVRETTTLQLRALGYQVVEVASAAEALRQVEDGLRPDALVTDHIMPDKTGAQLAQELRRRMPELPVLIITGYSNLTPQQISGYAVLAKPFRRNDLATRLAQLLASQRTD